MRNIIIAIAILAAGVANAGTAYFDQLRANGILINGHAPITNIVVNGTNYSGGSVEIPPGPQGPKGDTGSSSTNWIGYTFTNLNLNVTSNITVQVTTNITQSSVTNYVYTTNSDPASVTGAVYAAGTAVSVSNQTLYLGTNSFGGGGTLNHNALTNILGGGSNHISAAEQARIPPVWGSNTLGYLTCSGTNQAWLALGVNYASYLTITWDHQTNFVYAGIVTQQFAIPPVPGFHVPLIQIKAWGGGGGSAAQLGGNGGFAAGTYDGSAVTNILIMVGDGGMKAMATNNGSYAWPGGGPVYTNGATGCGGGGYTLVALNTITNYVLIAAGGGGGCANFAGGAGGGSIGASGSGGTVSATGGGMNAPGTGGSLSGNPTLAGQDGNGMSGGGSTTNAPTWRGGSGGGGYYGGGAGASGTGNLAGGAGGSCYGQYVERGNNTADESYFGTIGNAGSANSPGVPGGVVVRWRYVPD